MANVVYVDDSDSRIEYLGGWQTATDRRAHGSTLHALSGGGGGQTLTFNFTGTRIGIIGCAGDTDRFGFPGTAYDIDEIPQKIIIGVSHTYADTFTYNYTWFESEDLSPGEHSLRITAINTTAPNVYWVDYIWYLTATTTAPLPSIASSQLPTNSPLPSATSTPTSAAPSTTSATTTADDLGPAPNLLTTSSTTSTSSSSSTPSSTVSINSSAGKTSHPRNVGAIVGGTVGGAVFVTLLAVLAFFLLRRSGSSTKPLRDNTRSRRKHNSGVTGRFSLWYRPGRSPPSAQLRSCRLLRHHRK
ncbi:hypothetical protein C8Q77DRAFT_448893 [Trametes polyzona]|nr:hypothetical protein C8Q77DRAFT_448893 [Trametes polyzona]